MQWVHFSQNKVLNLHNKFTAQKIYELTAERNWRNWVHIGDRRRHDVQEMGVASSDWPKKSRQSGNVPAKKAMTSISPISWIFRLRTVWYHGLSCIGTGLADLSLATKHTSVQNALHGNDICLVRFADLSLIICLVRVYRELRTWDMNAKLIFL